MKLNEIIEQLKAENPQPYGQTNGVKYKMEGDELEDYYAQAAQAIADQNAKDLEVKAKESAKNALLERLGITEAEAKLLLG